MTDERLNGAIAQLNECVRLWDYGDSADLDPAMALSVLRAVVKEVRVEALREALEECDPRCFDYEERSAVRDCARGIEKLIAAEQQAAEAGAGGEEVGRGR